MENISTTSEAHSAECCDICGDKGITDALVTCTRCKSSCQHLYCMRICRVDHHPENWCCEDCERRNEKFSHNSGMREEAACKKLHRGSTQSDKLPSNSRQNFWDHKKKILSGKTKPLSAEEVIMLSSGAKTSLSPLKHTFRVYPVLGKSAATSVKSSSIQSKSSSQLVKAPVASKYFRPHTPTSSQMNIVAQQELPQSFKGLRGKNVDQAPAKNLMQRKENHNEATSKDLHNSEKIIQTTFKEQMQKEHSKEGQSDTVKIKIKEEKCELSFPSAPNVHGRKIVTSGKKAFFGCSLPFDYVYNPSNQNYGGGAFRDPETTSSVYHLSDPSLDASWNGSFRVSSDSRKLEISYEIQAHPPSRVLRKVYEFSKLMPEVLQFELVPFGDLSVDLIQQLCLDKRDIGLYFFPRDGERCENYGLFLELMESESLAMRTRVEGMELLIFTSKLLITNCQKWRGRHFLWGLFKKKTRCVRQANANECHTEPDSNEVDMDIDMIGGKDVVGRTDIAIPKEPLVPKMPEMTRDTKKMNSMGVKDVGKSDIVLSTESLRLKTEAWDDIPPGFENMNRRRL